MYTDIPWSDSGKKIKGNGNSFVFEYYKDDLIIYKVENGQYEVQHSKFVLFCMHGGPYIVNLNGQACTNFSKYKAIYKTEWRNRLAG